MKTALIITAAALAGTPAPAAALTIPAAAAKAQDVMTWQSRLYDTPAPQHKVSRCRPMSTNRVRCEWRVYRWAGETCAGGLLLSRRRDHGRSYIGWRITGPGPLAPCRAPGRVGS